METNMTVYLWLPHKDGQKGILAADRRRTNGGGRKAIISAAKKIIPVNPNMAYVCSGSTKYRSYFKDLVEDEAGDPLNFYLNFERKAKKLFNQHILSKPFSWFIVFAGIPGEDRLHPYCASANKKQRILVTEVDSMFSDGSVGSMYAKQYALKHWKNDFDLNTSAIIGYDAIQYANRHDRYCNLVDVFKATMEGFTPVDMAK
ncbi:MAG: hypothetical protein JSV39_02435 [Candidatus Aenigmatarchaeota archaeon]|nr:MAG: hypothetical protein JSV39_02435 [Candidatus Aenigmarchaeota archaeon]